MEKKIKKKISRNKKDTADIAAAFLEKLARTAKGRSARVVGLSGNLGAGKTAFVKAVARHLGVRETVNSPTFVLVKKYPVRKSRDYGFLIHIDAYRLKSEEELAALGWPEIIGQDGGLVFIEWPEKIRKAMPKRTEYIRISLRDDGLREFRFE